MAIDRTTDLQDLLDADEPIPRGTYEFSGQPVLRNGWISPRARLRYFGPAREDGAVKVPVGSWGETVDRLNLENVGDSIGTGVGIAIGRDTDAAPAGNQSGACVWTGVGVNGFERGIHVGDENGRAASELVFVNLDVRFCDTGIVLDAWNTLNVTLIQFMPNHLRVGLECIRASSVHVVGGAAARIRDNVFKFSQGGTFSVRNFRAETSGRLATVCDTTATCVTAIESCQTAGMIREDDIEVLVKWGGQLAIRDCLFEGKVFYESYPPTDRPIGYGTITLENTFTRSDVPIGWRPGVRAWYDIRSSGTVDAGYQIRTRYGPVSGQLGRVPIPVADSV